jgi:hypothetical protein
MSVPRYECRCIRDSCGLSCQYPDALPRQHPSLTRAQEARSEGSSKLLRDRGGLRCLTTHN